MADTWNNPNLPVAAKVLTLVRNHHGFSGLSEEEISSASEWNRAIPEIPWTKAARAHSLRARKRKVLLEEIPVGSMPVVLELNEGRSLVILLEKVSEDEFLVQFPDSRESLMERELLEECYSGTAVFLRKRGSRLLREWGLMSGGLTAEKASAKKRLAKAAREKSFRSALALNALFLIGTVAMVASHKAAYSEFTHQSFLLPILGILFGGAIALGLIRMRCEVIEEGRFSALADGVMIPVFAIAMAILAGWTAMPFMIVAALIGCYLLISRRIGSIASRISASRSRLLAGVFLFGAMITWTMAVIGEMAPAALTGLLVMGTYLISMVAGTDRLWQHLRLSRVE